MRTQEEAPAKGWQERQVKSKESESQVESLLLQLGIVDDSKLLVIQETEEFDKGEGYRVSLTPENLLIQLRDCGDERLVVIPIISVLDAIEAHNKLYGC